MFNYVQFSAVVHLLIQNVWGGGLIFFWTHGSFVLLQKCQFCLRKHLSVYTKSANIDGYQQTDKQLSLSHWDTNGHRYETVAVRHVHQLKCVHAISWWTVHSSHRLRRNPSTVSTLSHYYVINTVLQQATHTQTPHFHAHFPGKPGLAGCIFDFHIHLFQNCLSSWDRPMLFIILI